MLAILATGTLVSDPVSRTSAAGKPYTTASIKIPAENSESMLASVIAFAEDPADALLALKKGDACAIAGRAKLSSWTRTGRKSTASR